MSDYKLSLLEQLPLYGIAVDPGAHDTSHKKEKQLSAASEIHVRRCLKF
jgi:hypothetical protein